MPTTREQNRKRQAQWKLKQQTLRCKQHGLPVELPALTVSALICAGLSFKEAVAMTDKELLKLHFIGKSGIDAIRKHAEN